MPTPTTPLGTEAPFAPALGAGYHQGMAAASTELAPEPFEAERRFVLHDVPWWTYVAMRDALEGTGTRMTFLQGALELMSPSDLHGEAKSLIARFVEAWAEEKDVDLRAFGSTTFRREAKQRGLEPDECYTLGAKEPDGVPHLAIEVVIGSPLVDKLSVYAGLGVSEVWIWRAVAARIEPWIAMVERKIEQLLTPWRRAG